MCWLIPCRVCDGDGELSEPHPFAGDPFYEVVTKCPNCNGEGYVPMEVPEYDRD